MGVTRASSKALRIYGVPDRLPGSASARCRLWTVAAPPGLAVLLKRNRAESGCGAADRPLSRHSATRISPSPLLGVSLSDELCHQLKHKSYPKQDVAAAHEPNLAAPSSE